MENNQFPLLIEHTYWARQDTNQYLKLLIQDQVQPHSKKKTTEKI